MTHYARTNEKFHAHKRGYLMSNLHLCGAGTFRLVDLLLKLRAFAPKGYVMPVPLVTPEEGASTSTHTRRHSIHTAHSSTTQARVSAVCQQLCCASRT